MGVNDSANLGKLSVEQGVGVQVAGGPQRTFDNFSVEVGNHQVGRCQGGIIHATGLDHHQGLRAGAVDSAGIAKGMWRQAAARNLLVGVKHLIAKGGKQHGGILERLRVRKRLPQSSLTATTGLSEEVSE
jgi:hypothetical protein